METAEKNLDLSLLLEFYGGLLTPRQREILLAGGLLNYTKNQGK